MKSVADGLIIHDAGGAIESFNPAVERIFGYDAGDIQARGLETLLPGGLPTGATGETTGSSQGRLDLPRGLDRRQGDHRRACALRAFAPRRD